MGISFLLVPEATSVDTETRNLLLKAKEKDFYLSQISPLGVPFNTIKGTSNELLKNQKEAKGRYGSSCPKKLLALSKEYSPEGMCTASRKYQDIKLNELYTQKETLSTEEFDRRKAEITDKACLCVGLVNSAYMEQGMEIKGEKQGVVICPGRISLFLTRKFPFRKW
jgi:NAD(P)H-dependent flavin oxidoreductase YrpB (nitropropane dioxygenase family)